MAEVKVNYTPTPAPIESITLTVSVEEAQAFLSVMWVLGGDPNRTWRKYANAVQDALLDEVNGLYRYPYANKEKIHLEAAELPGYTVYEYVVSPQLHTGKLPTREESHDKAAWDLLDAWASKQQVEKESTRFPKF